MLVSGLVLALYFWVFFAGIGEVSSALLVSDTAALLAGGTFVAGFVSYLWTPKNYISETALVNFMLLIAVIAVLLANTGYLYSPFVALWILVSVFAPLFGWFGISAIAFAVIAYITTSVLDGLFTVQDILALLLITVIPLAVGFIISTQLRKTAHRGEKSAYSQLASELSAVEGKSEVVIAAIADGVVALDKAGVVELINPAAQALIGWGKSDALGLDYKSVLKLYNNRDKTPEPTNDPIYQALSTNKQVHSATMSIATTDGNKKFLAAITASPVGTEKDGVIVVFRDITREKAEEREQAEFISTASHEMRTPVASIEGYLGLALNPRTAQIDDKARDFITKAHESAQHLGRLFQDLLDVSRVDDERLNSNPEVIDVVDFTHSITQGLLASAQTKGLHLNYKPRPDLQGDSDGDGERTLTPIYYAEVDKDHLREVAANLIENAIKYTSQGTIDIDVTGDNEHVTLSIADSGIGIPKADIPHLFQKFYRVDDSDTREIGGTGLGLYLSRKLVESMHGKIWVDSEYQQGSTFCVQLPRLANAEAKQKLENAASEPHSGPVHAQPATQQPEPTPQSLPTTAMEQRQPASPPPVQYQQQVATEQPSQQPAQPPHQNAGPTPRPSLADMSPRTAPLTPPPRPAPQYQSQPPQTSAPTSQPNQLQQNTQPTPAATRQNIPISTLEEQSHQYVRQMNTPPNQQQQ